MNFGRAIGLFNRFSPKISKGIGQVANIARNIGQAVQNVRNIGSTVNAMSGGRIGSTPFGQKIARMLGATRRSGYPSDSSRRRRSQRVDGLTATSTPAIRRPHRPGPGSGIALPPGRCKLGRLPAALTGPGRGATVSSRPDGASRR